jgi:aspartate/methionine/tyrosine aminotransferase
VSPFPFLAKTSLWAALSPLGQSIETPKGIFYWSNRAKTEAEIDGTIGIAQDDDGTISHIAATEPWAGAKVMERAAKGKVFAYAPIEGMESLRKKWLARILSKHPGLIHYAALPVVTNGITHALAIASRLLLEKGQILVTADKSWENYEHIYRDVQGVKISTFPLFTNGALHIDALIGACREVAQLQKKVVLLLNFPHNQTGFMPSVDDAKELGQRIQKLCREMPELPFVVLLDDAYEGYVYDETGQK